LGGGGASIGISNRAGRLFNTVSHHTNRRGSAGFGHQRNVPSRTLIIRTRKHTVCIATWMSLCSHCILGVRIAVGSTHTQTTRIEIQNGRIAIQPHCQPKGSVRKATPHMNSQDIQPAPCVVIEVDEREREMPLRDLEPVGRHCVRIVERRRKKHHWESIHGVF